MKKNNRIKIILSCFAVFIFILLLLKNPTVASSGAIKGILLCGNVIIPSLFPFSVCVLFLMKTPIFSNLKFLNRFAKKIFGLNSEQLSVMLLSFIGGYPIGAKLINELYENGKISQKNAAFMLNYCVNAGPAFIVLFIGSGLLENIKLGYVLLASHIIVSLIIATSMRRFISNEQCSLKSQEVLSFGDNFVLSVSQASTTVFGICSYVIFFSTITQIINRYAEYFDVLRIFEYILEVTVGIGKTNNIYLISFLLGFAGISIWCQIIAVSHKIKYNFLIFALFRVLHGVLSSLFTYLLLKIFHIHILTSSTYNFELSYSNVAVTFSLLITVMIFIISVFSKKYSGNIISDLV